MASTYQTLSNVYDDVRYNSSKDSNTLVDGDLLRLSNKYFSIIMRELVDINEDIYAEISTADLVNEQQEYTLPVDSTSSTFGGGLVKLQRVEVTYDDGNVWRVADSIDMNNLSFPATTNSDINSHFSSGDPKYSQYDRSIFLYPIPDTASGHTIGTGGLRLFWIKRPNEMTSSSDVPELPKDFLNILSEGMLIDVFRKIGKIAEMDRAQATFERALVKMRQMEVHTDQPLRFNTNTILQDYK